MKAQTVRIAIAFAWFIAAGAGLASAAEEARRVNSLSDLNRAALSEPVQSRWGRDPFDLEPIGLLGGASGGDLVLSGVVYRPGAAVAILNERLVRVGDAVEGWSVTAILPDRVVLRGPGGVRELFIKPFAMR